MATPKDERSEAQYLGDGVYVSYDGYQVKLFTHNGKAVTNAIFLDHLVADSLRLYLEKKKFWPSSQ
jgi:hypothetical protein